MLVFICLLQLINSLSNELDIYYFDVGQACALAYILFIVIFILAVLQRFCIKEG